MLTSKSTLMCMITRYPFHKLIEVVAHLQKGIVVFQAIILQLVLFDLLIVSLYRVNKRFGFVCLFGAHAYIFTDCLNDHRRTAPCRSFFSCIVFMFSSLMPCASTYNR